MIKTTVYLPDELLQGVKRVARQRGVSEAEVIRESVRELGGRERPRPRGALYSSGDPISHRVDELMEGFGTR